MAKNEAMPNPEQHDRAKLWSDYAKNQTQETRNLIVMEYLGLVKTIVLRMLPTYRKHIDYDDLMSCGVLGLMDAVDKFDPAKEVKFETYATLRIKGEIIDQIRKQDWAPISLRQKIKRVEEGYDSLEATLGRVPTEREVASHIEMSPEDVKKTLDESHTFNLVALDEMLMDRVGVNSLPANADSSPEASYEDKEVRHVLAQCVDQLPEREKLVVSLYYKDELTLKEIGLVLGVTESRISQIHSKALMTLRNKLERAFAV